MFFFDIFEILDIKFEWESYFFEIWYDNYKCGLEMVEGDGLEFIIDYLVDISDEEEEG